MRHFMSRSVLSVAVFVGALALSGSAGATTWHNYKSGKCLSIKSPNQEGVQLIIEDCAPVNAPLLRQQWNLINDPTRFGYFNLFNGMSFPAPNSQQLVGVQAAKMDNGRPIILWRPTGELNQAWSLNLGPSDAAGKPCYWFGDAASPSTPMVMGVAAGTTTSGSPIIIWPLTMDAAHNFVVQPDQYWCPYN